MMRKLLIFTLLCTAVCCAAAKQYVRNGDFTKLNAKGSPVYWFSQGPKDPACGVEKEVMPPDYKGNVYRIAGNSLLCQDSLAITPGKAYTVRCLMKTADLPWKAQARLQLIWLDRNKRELLIDNPSAPGKKMWSHKWVWTSGTTDWKEYKIDSFTAPENAGYARIRIGKTGGAEGKVYYADVRMEECAAADSFENRVAAIPFASDVEKGTVIDDFMIPAIRTKSNYPTTVKASYDGKNIYLKFKCDQPNIGGEQFDSEDKSKLEDAVEVLFLRPGDKRQYHLLVYPGGKVEGVIEHWGTWPMIRDPWDYSAIKAKVGITDNFWTVDMTIPFAALGLKKAPADGETWRASFCRNVSTRGKELSAWANLPSAHFQRSEGFGKIIFRKNSLFVSSPRVSPAGLHFTVSNPSKTAKTLTAQTVEHTEKGAFSKQSRNFTIPPNSRKEFDFPAKTEAKNMLWAEFREGDALLSKHCALPNATYLKFEFLDPEKVRTQKVYLATDHPFFIAWTMHHNLPSKASHNIIRRNQKKVDFVIEVPEGLDFSCMMHDASAYRWNQSAKVRPQVTPFTENGKKMNRFRFALPLIADWSEPQFLFFYNCRMKPGAAFSANGWFELDGKKETEAVYSFETIEVGKVSRPLKRLPHNIGLMDAVTLYAWFPQKTLEHYSALGFNCVSIPVEKMKSEKFYEGNAPVTREEHFDLLYREFLNAKTPFFMNTVSITTGPAQHVWTRKDYPGTVAYGRDGKKVKTGGYNGSPALCWSYRGPYHKAWIERFLTSSAFGKYRITWLAMDMEIWRRPVFDQICYCPRCLELFKKFCVEQNRPDLAKVNPCTETSGDFRKMWRKFQTRSASTFVTSAFDAVEAKVKGAPSTSPSKDFIRQDYTSPGWHYEDGALDIFESSFYNTPENVYKKFVDHRKILGLNSTNLASGFSFGQTGGCPDWHVIPRHLKENLFEAAVFGARNIVYYYYLYVEPLRMREIVKAVNAISPCEDIVLDGKITSCVSADNPGMLLTGRELGNERLIAVRAYGAAKDLCGNIKLAGVTAPVNVYDCETGKIVGKVTPQKPYFKYSVAKGHCRLLYAGSEQQWTARRK